MANILVNTRFLIKDKLEGIGRFTYESLKRITQNHPEHQFFFLFDRQWDEEFIFSDNITPIKIGPQARHPFLWYWWFHQSVPKIINEIKPHVFLSTDGYTTFKTNVKKVTVFHDLAFEHYPEGIPYFAKKYYQTFTPGYAQVSDRIATVSEYSRQDLVKTYGVNKDKVDVVYNGSSDYFKPIDEIHKAKAKSKYTNGSDYFCFVGALHPRKNIVNLFKAFDSFKSKGNNNIKLVIVGRKAWNTEEISRTFENMKFKDDVVFTGHLAHKAIAEIYGASFGLIYVPFFEGFGIPIIEAQNSGCPVVTSNLTSMPEVVGDGGITINPKNIDDISKAMEKLLNLDLRNDLARKGFENAKHFSWDLTAEKLWETVEKVL